jgi:stage V sporulation protein SpoVS
MTAAPREPQAVRQADNAIAYSRGFLDGAVMVLACVIVFGLLMLALWSVTL